VRARIEQFDDTKSVVQASSSYLNELLKNSVGRFAEAPLREARLADRDASTGRKERDMACEWIKIEFSFLSREIASPSGLRFHRGLSHRETRGAASVHAVGGKSRAPSFLFPSFPRFFFHIFASASEPSRNSSDGKRRRAPILSVNNFRRAEGPA